MDSMRRVGTFSNIISEGVGKKVTVLLRTLKMEVDSTM